MRSDVIVVMPPALERLARAIERVEYLLVQQFISEPAIETFDERVLLRLTGRAVMPGDAITYSFFRTF